MIVPGVYTNGLIFIKFFTFFHSSFHHTNSKFNQITCPYSPQTPHFAPITIKMSLLYTAHPVPNKRLKRICQDDLKRSTLAIIPPQMTGGEESFVGCKRIKSAKPHQTAYTYILNPVALTARNTTVYCMARIVAAAAAAALVVTELVELFYVFTFEGSKE